MHSSDFLQLVMTSDATHMQADLDTYNRLFSPYQDQLKYFEGRDGEYGARFALLFRQILRLLVLPGDLNDLMPRTFGEVAKRYLGGDADTVRHFSYEDNRHFFLSDLFDWLKIYERGRQMRRMGR